VRNAGNVIGVWCSRRRDALALGHPQPLAWSPRSILWAGRTPSSPSSATKRRTGGCQHRRATISSAPGSSPIRLRAHRTSTPRPHGRTQKRSSGQRARPGAVQRLSDLSDSWLRKLRPRCLRQLWWKNCDHSSSGDHELIRATGRRCASSPGRTSCSRFHARVAIPSLSVLWLLPWMTVLRSSTASAPSPEHGVRSVRRPTPHHTPRAPDVARPVWMCRSTPVGTCPSRRHRRAVPGNLPRHAIASWRRRMDPARLQPIRTRVAVGRPPPDPRPSHPAPELRQSHRAPRRPPRWELDLVLRWTTRRHEADHVAVVPHSSSAPSSDIRQCAIGRRPCRVRWRLSPRRGTERRPSARGPAHRR